MNIEPQKNPDGNSDEHGDILAHYVNMAQVLGKMFSPVLETVVHDLRKPESSIIAIYNGDLTGREVGDSVTSVAQKLMEGEFPDMVVGYKNESPNGQKLKSSSLAIRDDDELIGVMGLNLDISYFDKYSKFIDQFISSHRSEYISEREHFKGSTDSPEDEIENAINRFIFSKNWNNRNLSYDDKREIVEFLYKEGYFNIKGAVTTIADKLGLTRPSVYNYKNDYINGES